MNARELPMAPRGSEELSGALKNSQTSQDLSGALVNSRELPRPRALQERPGASRASQTIRNFKRINY